jgi:hypothetical protein
MAKTELGIFIANKLLHNFILKGDFHELDHHGDEVKLSSNHVVANFSGNEINFYPSDYFTLKCSK